LSIIAGDISITVSVSPRQDSFVEGETSIMEALIAWTKVCLLSLGCDGSIGTNTPPAFMIPSIATIAHGDFSKQKGTTVSGATPIRAK
jgi:hypothetical protein